MNSSDSFTVLISGSRDWTDVGLVYTMLDWMLWLAWAQGKELFVLVGDCPTGADKFTLDWAEEHGVAHKKFEARWDRYGLSAGPRRNAEMVDDRPDVAVVFPLGESRGTRGCAKLARDAGVLVLDLGSR